MSTRFYLYSPISCLFIKILKNKNLNKQATHHQYMQADMIMIRKCTHVLSARLLHVFEPTSKYCCTVVLILLLLCF